MELSLANVVNISVSAAPQGIGEYNTSNLALFTREVPEESFGSLGYKIYLDPQEVAVDFGSDSDTFLLANTIFSQNPNILAGGGYLVVIEYADTADVTAVQTLTFSAEPAAGSYELVYDGENTISLAYDANAATVQSALQSLTGLGSVTVTGSPDTAFVVTFTGVSGPAVLLEIAENSLQDAGGINVEFSAVTTTAGTTLSTETLAAAITRTQDLVQYFGIVTEEILSQVNMLAAAAVVQPLNKILFMVQRDAATIAEGGALDLLRTGGFTKTRGLFYGSDNDLDAVQMAAAYASRGLSTNFDGSNTTSTMHLKDLIGIQPDPTMTQTRLALAQAAGADIYASFQGVPKVFTSGANDFFDQVYNLEWFVGALQVAGFNALAETSTKVPQTEQGVAVLSGAYRGVCERGITNQYIGAGTWNSSTTFGNLEDFKRNISERGYYIYSQPVALQSQAARADREAPLIQIAVKEAGAIHKTDVIIYVNP